MLVVGTSAYSTMFRVFLHTDWVTEIYCLTMYMSLITWNGKITTHTCKRHLYITISRFITNVTSRFLRQPDKFSAQSKCLTAICYKPGCVVEVSSSAWLRLIAGSMASLIWLLAPFGSRSVAQLKCIKAKCVLPSFLCTFTNEKSPSGTNTKHISGIGGQNLLEAAAWLKMCLDAVIICPEQELIPHSSIFKVTCVLQRSYNPGEK